MNWKIVLHLIAHLQTLPLLKFLSHVADRMHLSPPNFECTLVSLHETYDFWYQILSFTALVNLWNMMIAMMYFSLVHIFKLNIFLYSISYETSINFQRLVKLTFLSCFQTRSLVLTFSIAVNTSLFFLI